LEALASINMFDGVILQTKISDFTFHFLEISVSATYEC